MKRWIFVAMKSFVVLFGLTAVIGGPEHASVFGSEPAHAVVGRPLTPVSYAGVARRTTRRAVYATGTATSAAVATTVATLPGGCATVVSGGFTYHHCGSVYYKPVYDGPNVVYVQTTGPG